MVKKKINLKSKLLLVAGGVFLFLALLEAGMRLGGFIFLSLQERNNQAAFRKKGAYRILCLGESTTAGQYPLFLEEILNQSGPGINFSLIDKGIHALTTDVIIENLEENLDKYKPDMVIAMMGANDPLQPVYYKGKPGFLSSLKIYKLAALLVKHAKIKFQGGSAAAGNSANRQTQSANDYLSRGDYPAAEILLKKAAELEPPDYRAQIELAWFYMSTGDYEHSRLAFSRAIELDPGREEAYVGMLVYYRDKRDYLPAREYFQKIIRINPRSPEAYAKFGQSLKEEGKFGQAAALLEKALELDPLNPEVYILLGWCYKELGDYAAAEAVLKKAAGLSPGAEQVYAAMSLLYAQTGKTAEEKIYAQKAEEIRNSYYNVLTMRNYCKLKEILDKRKIKLVCVQYPMRSVLPLKRMLSGYSGIVFVDNEDVFKAAVKASGYPAYFTDNFAGDFGHCTARGNRLLAQNIAETLLKEVFYK